jgi:hypothetical protein
MSRNKKWSSNDKNQLLVENFRNFMEEGDFSPDEDLNERSWGQMAKDVVKGDFTGSKREAQTRETGEYWLKEVEKRLQRPHDNLRGALEDTLKHSSVNTERLPKDLEAHGAKDIKDLIDITIGSYRLQSAVRDHKRWADGIIDDSERAEAAKKRRAQRDWDATGRAKQDAQDAKDRSYHARGGKSHSRKYEPTRGDITPGNKDYGEERRATTGRWDEAKKRNK